MNRKSKKRKTEPAEMNLTPMIDVTFLLLIFFLLGTKFKEPEGKLNAYLPKDKGPPPKNIAQIDPEEELTIRVRMLPGRRNPVYTLGDIDYPTVAQLESKMRTLYSLNPEQPVTIDPDPAASYERVIWVLNACVRVGYSEIAFAAPIPEGPQVTGAARAPM
jgi:biopolymer transport protein ExbD